MESHCGLSVVRFNMPCEPDFKANLLLSLFFCPFLLLFQPTNGLAYLLSLRHTSLPFLRSTSCTTAVVLASHTELCKGAPAQIDTTPPNIKIHHV
jgi:hypothetical protein